jgi:hypothetical protein
MAPGSLTHTFLFTNRGVLCCAVLLRRGVLWLSAVSCGVVWPIVAWSDVVWYGLGWCGDAVRCGVVV